MARSQEIDTVEGVQRDHLNSAELTAISIMRSIPEDQSVDAFKWFEGIAKKKNIRDSVLSVLEKYVRKEAK